MEKIKVIIADDSDFVRDGMKIILDVDDDFEVLGCASNGREAIEIANRITVSGLVTNPIGPVTIIV